ncbi:MAG: hypothetical protein ACOC5B_04075, partial [Myxococcota bacterium]
YSSADPLATGLDPAIDWQSFQTGGLTTTNGTGRISQDPPRSNVSPRIQGFADWMLNENAVDGALRFGIPEPRSRALEVNAPAEEFTYCEGGGCSGGSVRPQQVAFFTPLGAPEEAKLRARGVHRLPRVHRQHPRAVLPGPLLG